MDRNTLQNDARWRGHVGPLPTVAGSPFAAMQLAGAWGVWLDGGSRRITAALLDAVLRVLDEFRGIVWHVSDGGSRPSTIKERLRVFGQYPGLLDGELVASQTLDFGDRRVYADTGWARADATEELARLLSRSTAPTDVSLALLRPGSASTMARWSAALLGLLWIWIRSATGAPEKNAPELRSTVVELLVREALELDGVIALLLDTDDVGRLLVLVTHEARARTIRERLDMGSAFNWMDSAADMGRPQWLGLVR